MKRQTLKLFGWTVLVNSSTLTLFLEDKMTVKISVMILKLPKNKPTTEVLNSAAGWLQGTGFTPPAPAPRSPCVAIPSGRARSRSRQKSYIKKNKYIY